MNAPFSWPVRAFARALLCALCIVAARGQTSGTALAALADKPPFERAAALRARYQALPAADFPAELAAAAALRQPLQDEALAVLARAWAARDPAGALSAILASPPTPAKDGQLSLLFQVWAAQNPKAAFAALKAHAGDPQRYPMLEGYFQGFAQKDPAEAFAFLTRQKTESPGLVPDETPLAVLVFCQWAQTDPQNALLALLKDGHDANTCALSGAFLPLWFREDPEGCWKALGKLPQKGERDHMRKHLFLDAAISFDGADTLIAFFNAENDEDSAWMAGLLFTSLAKEDRPRALALAETLRQPKQRNKALASVYAQWAKDDFAAAIRAIQTLPDAKLRAEAYEDAWKERIDDEPLPRHIHELMSLPDPVSRKDLLQRSLERYRKDGGELGALMRQMRTPRAQRDLLTAISQSYAPLNLKSQQETEAFRQWAMLLPAGDSRIRLLSCVFSGNLQMSDMAWMQENLKPGEFHRLALDMLYRSNEGKNSLLNPENINAFPDGPLRDHFIGSLAQKIAEESPQKAREWIFSLSPGGARDDAYSTCIAQMIVKKQWAEAQAAMRETPEGYVLPDHTYTLFAAKMAGQDMAGALAWACAQEDPEARASALRGITWESANQTPEEFFTQMQGVMQMPESAQAIASFVANWSGKDAAAAAKWLQANTNCAAAPKAADSVMRNWVAENPMEATQWLATLPEGALRNEAIFGLATSQEMQKSPDEVFAWIVTLPEYVNEKTSREDLVLNVIIQLSEENREKANALLANPKLTDKERATVQKYLSQLPSN